MEEHLVAKKIVALLHDPPFKALLLAGTRIEGIGCEKGSDYHEVVADELVRRFITELRRAGKGDLAGRVEDEWDKYLAGEHVVRVADRYAASAERTVTMLFRKSLLVPEVRFMNALDGFSCQLDRIERGKITSDLLNKLAYRLAEACREVEPGFEFHAMWRALLPATVQALDSPEASLLPADTRAPFLTVYDHLSATSALTGCIAEGEPAIFAFEIKAVQDYISRSRSVRDLWASSYLLSLLLSYVIVKLSEELGPDAFISPCLLGLPLYDLWLHQKGLKFQRKFRIIDLIAPVVPEKAIFLVPSDKCKEVEERVHQYLREAWRTVCTVAKDSLELNEVVLIKHIESHLAEYTHDELLEEQPLPFEVQTSWAVVPRDYEKRRKALENLVDQRLVTREGVEALQKLEEQGTKVFELPFFVEAVVRKLGRTTPRIVSPTLLAYPLKADHRYGICTMCWQRPSILLAWREGVTTKNERILREGERLCVACAIKRVLGCMDVLRRVLEHLIGGKVAKMFDEAIKSVEQRGRGVLPRLPPSMPSTDTLASMSFRLTALRLALKRDLVKQAIKEFVNELEKLAGREPLRLYSDMPHLCLSFEELLEEDLTGELLKFALISGEFLYERGLRAFGGEGGSAIEALRRLVKIVQKEVLLEVETSEYTIATEPGLYIAIVKADGDDVGKMITLSGRFSKKLRDLVPEQFRGFVSASNELQELNYVAGPSHMMAVSRSLRTLALKAYELCHAQGAFMVYSGGDDLLAMCPPELALQLAAQLREHFSATTHEIEDRLNGAKMVVQGLGSIATQSFAINMTHYLSPLPLELKSSAKELMDVAKGLEGKDSLVVAYKPRAGESITALLRWSALSPADITSFILTFSALTADLPRRFEVTIKPTRYGGKNIAVLPLRSHLGVSKRAPRDALLLIGNVRDPRLLASLSKYELGRHSKGNDKDASGRLVRGLQQLSAITLRAKDLDEKELSALLETFKLVLCCVESSSHVFMWGTRI